MSILPKALASVQSENYIMVKEKGSPEWEEKYDMDINERLLRIWNVLYGCV